VFEVGGGVPAAAVAVGVFAIARLGELFLKTYFP